MSAFDTHARMRVGDASAWPRWNPQFLPADEVMEAWQRAMKSAGAPGSPSTLRIYTHFTYCEASCDFCMYFHKVPSEEAAYTRYADHLVSLVERFGERCGRVRASAAYFGGGTPSAMPRPQLERYLRAFRHTFDVAGEFSVEAHPRSADVELVTLLAAFGVNRVSMGIQSLEPAVLRTITRRNKPVEHITEVVAAARTAGVLINLDLCLGLPGQTLASFQSDVRALLPIGPDVITLYLYQPVSRLPSDPPLDMTYDRALDDDLRRALEDAGYVVADALAPGAVVVRLLRRDAAALRSEPKETYALFDAEPSHLIGLGPGAYCHVFGYGWFREATSIEALGREQAVYWGTRMTRVDEYRQIVLDALARGRALDLPRLDAALGLSGNELFAAPLERARASGLLVTRSGTETFTNVADGALADDVRAQIVDALLPSLPAEGSTPADAPAHEPALVVLRSKRGRSADADPELVRRWCEALEIPARGHRFYGATIKDVDDRSVYFAVASQKAEPLRVFVRAPGAGNNVYQSKRFGLSYAARANAPLTDSERKFFVFLANRTRLADQDPT